MSPRHRTWLLPALLGLAGAALAAGPSPDAAERQRIAAERAAVQQRFDQAQRDCAKRFVVTDCLDAARAERRAAMDGLQRQTHLLDDARRRERAAERLRVIKAREEAASAPAPVLARPRAPPAPPASAVPRHVPRLPALPSTGSGAAAHQRAFQARQQAAQEHQQAVQARNARQDAKKPPAAGLPVPGASAP